MEEALKTAKESPIGTAVETVTSRARKEAVLQHMKEKETLAKPAVRRVLQQVIKKAEVLPVPPVKRVFPSVLRSPRVNIKPHVLSPPVTASHTANLRIDERFVAVFGALAPVVVSDDEEKTRLRGFRQRMIEANAMGVIGYVRKVIEVVGGGNRSVVDPKKPRKATLRNCLAVHQTGGTD
jgi:hypothetical protein